MGIFEIESVVYKVHVFLAHFYNSGNDRDCDTDITKDGGDDEHETGQGNYTYQKSMGNSICMDMPLTSNHLKGFQ